jgi:arsenical pump membrane protein
MKGQVKSSAASPSTSAHAAFRWDGLLALGGAGGALIALGLATHSARQAASQTWSPFVLVAGLLMVGLAAEEDGLFRTAGHRLARLASRGWVLFAGGALMIVVVTATLNLDTSVVFVTPVLVATARHRGGGEAPLLYASLLLANASSLFLPGSNLTNLIVLGHHPQSGGSFLAIMWPAAAAACAVTAGCVWWWGRHQLASVPSADLPREPAPVGLGLIAVVLSVLFVLVFSAPALPVLGVGLTVTLVRLLQRKIAVPRVGAILGLPVLIGLFGMTVVMGVVGREWSGPHDLLSHADVATTTVIAAVSSVLLNNLPAASLLASGPPHHAAALLIGLNVGPNLFVTGSMAWFLWLRVARASGAEPSVAQACRIGMVAVPLSIAAAVGALWLS